MNINLKSQLIIFFSFISIVQGSPDRMLFTDSNLKDVLALSNQKSTSGLIYVWSPRMPLSVLGVEELTLVARKLKLPLTVLVDPAAVESEIVSVSNQNPILRDSFRLDSAVLTSMSMKIHYPSLVLYKNGQLLSPSRPGYDEPDRIEDYLIRRLK